MVLGLFLSVLVHLHCPLPHKQGWCFGWTSHQEALFRVQLNYNRDPVVPPVRDDNGKVIKLGKFWHLRVSDTFVEKAIASVEANTVESLMFEVIENFVDGAGPVDKIVANEVDKNVEMLQIVLPPPAVAGDLVGGHLGGNQGVGDVVEASFSSMDVEPSEKSADNIECRVGVKLSRGDSGSPVSSMESSPVSPPRSRKVAVASTSEHGRSQKVSSSLGQDAGTGRIVRFKNLDIAFNDGTENGGGQMHF